MALRRAELATLEGNLAATTVSVNFDMDSAIAEPHRRMQAAFDRMATSQRVWSVRTTQRIDRVKARSWADTIVSRGPAVFKRLAAPLVDTQDLPLALPVLGGNSTAYFYPGFVLVDGGRRADFALIDVTELGISAAVSNFTETELVPSDSQVVGTTWAKANKNGTRDRRFAHNRELPILRYGCLNLSTAGGMDEAFMFSNPQASADFAAEAEKLKRLLLGSQTTNHLAESQLLESPRTPQTERVIRQCPNCGSSLRLPKGCSGKVRCPGCKSGFSTTT